MRDIPMQRARQVTNCLGRLSYSCADRTSHILEIIHTSAECQPSDTFARM